MADDRAFQETTEGVKAKLEVEVPEKALTTLTALSKQTEAYRISLEAVARAGGDHKDYLESMPQIADLATNKLKEWCDQVERAVDLKGKLGDFTGIPGAVGQDSANPFGAAVLGRGDLGNLLNPMAQSDPNRIVSMGAQRGLVDKQAVGGMNDEQIKQLANALTQAVGGETPNDGGGGKRPARPGQGDPEDDEGLSPQKLEQGALKGRDLIGNVLGEMGPGKSLGDMIGAGKDALGGLEGMGGTLGKVAGALGPIGAGVGLALTANQLIQMGGQQYQQYKNLGGQTGDGAGQGMAYDARAKMLALDPFISTAQAREVIQGALSAGMGGDSFDTVTQFMAKNLKDMNLQVGDSVKLLKDNVEKGGMSIDQLSTSLANVSAMAKGASQGRDELLHNFGANTAALANVGVNGPQGTIATQFQGMFKDSPLLSSVGDTILQTALADPVFQTAVANEAGGLGGGITPDVAIQKLADSGQLSATTISLLTRLAKQAQASSRDPYQQANNFMRLAAQGAHVNLDPNTARGLYERLIKPGGMEAAVKQGDDATKAGLAPIDTSFVTGSTRGLETLGSQAANLFGGALNMVGGMLDGSSEDAYKSMMDRKGEIDRTHEADAGMYTNKILQTAVKQYGTDQLQVYDSSGKNAQKLDQSNKEQRDKLAAGELLIAAPGQKPQTLEKFGVGDTSGSGGGGNVNVSASPLTVRYEGPISGPTSVPLTTNQMQANAGANNATDNKVPVGNR